MLRGIALYILLFIPNTMCSFGKIEQFIYDATTFCWVKFLDQRKYIVCSRFTFRDFPDKSSIFLILFVNKSPTTV